MLLSLFEYTCLLILCFYSEKYKQEIKLQQWCSLSRLRNEIGRSNNIEIDGFICVSFTKTSLTVPLRGIPYIISLSNLSI